MMIAGRVGRWSLHRGCSRAGSLVRGRVCVERSLQRLHRPVRLARDIGQRVVHGRQFSHAFVHDAECVVRGDVALLVDLLEAAEVATALGHGEGHLRVAVEEFLCQDLGRQVVDFVLVLRLDGIRKMPALSGMGEVGADGAGAELQGGGDLGDREALSSVQKQHVGQGPALAARMGLVVPAESLLGPWREGGLGEERGGFSFLPGIVPIAGGTR